MFRESQQIGLYTLIRRLGRGGFGEVWLAEDADGQVAVKLPHKDQVDWKSITQEIGLWTLCGKHPNVMPLVGARNFDGQIAIISEYAPDGSLEDLLKAKGKLPVEEAVEMTIGILEGLQHLHESGIIHRDLKPANILLDGNVPRLTDFGISRIISADSLSETIAGTFAYIAPECFDGKRNVQTDIWSVGVILYRMLMGNLPFPQKEQTELIGAIIMREPKTLPTQLSFNLQETLSKVLSKRQDDRYTEVGNFLAELKQTQLYLKSKPYFTTLLSQLGKPENDTERNIQLFFDFLSKKIKPEAIYKMKPFILRFFEEVNLGLIDIEYEPENAFQTKPKNFLNLTPCLKADKWGFCDEKSEVIIPAKYADAEEFSEGLARVRIDGKKGLDDAKYGFVDQLGIEVIPLKYDYAEAFAEGLACVNLNGKYGFIDKTGKEFTKIKYDNASSFCGEGYGFITLNGKRGFINRDGTEDFSGLPKREYLSGFYLPRD